jgi:hypothetical protein
MVQFFENENMMSENTSKMFIHDVMDEEYEINFSLQTESSKTS